MKMLAQLLVISCLLIHTTMADHSDEHSDEAYSTLNRTLPITISPIVILPSAGNQEACPSDQVRETARRNLSEQVRATLREVVQPILASKEVPQCGEGKWLQVASLNMTNPSEQCPGNWLELSQPSRSCGRRTAGAGSCDSAYFGQNSLTYNRVCGRLTGDSTSSPDGFTHLGGTAYLDGVSVTYGEARTHIWSLAAGHPGRCPCENENRDVAQLPPDFIGENYFCDTTGTNGKLWDGEDCTNDCCTFHSPPWFKVQLSKHTNERIEMRVCGDQDTGDENIHVEYIEVYVQ